MLPQQPDDDNEGVPAGMARNADNVSDNGSEEGETAAKKRKMEEEAAARMKAGDRCQVRLRIMHILCPQNVGIF